MACALEPLVLVRGEDLLVEVARYHEVNGTGVPTDCTGWSVSAEIVYQNTLTIPILCDFTDAANGLVGIDITEENVDLIHPIKGSKLVITWVDVAGRKKRTRLMVEVCDG